MCLTRSALWAIQTATCQAWGCIRDERARATLERIAVDPDEKEYNLFHALTRFFFHSAAQAPLLVVVEDLHWSDDTRLGYLLRLARRLSARPLLLLLAYRSDEEDGKLAEPWTESDGYSLMQPIGALPRSEAAEGL